MSPRASTYGRPQCEALAMEATPKYARRCWQPSSPGSKYCSVHGGRQPRLVVKQGARRDFVELSCEHLSYSVRFNTSDEARRDWPENFLRMTADHPCFRALRSRYRVKVGQ